MLKMFTNNADTIHNAEQRKRKQSHQCGNISLGQSVHIQYICAYKSTHTHTHTHIYIYIYILFYIGTEQTDVAQSYMGGARFKPCLGYLTSWGFLWFAEIIPFTRPRHLPSTSFSIHHSPIILSIDATQSEQLAASYNISRKNTLLHSTLSFGISGLWNFIHRPVLGNVNHWRSALCNGPNGAGVCPLTWGRKQIQFPKRCVL
jgi:hypothetical protein